MSGTKRTICTLVVVAALFVGVSSRSEAAGETIQLTMVSLAPDCPGGPQTTYDVRWVGTATHGSRLALVKFEGQSLCNYDYSRSGPYGTFTINELDGSVLTLLVLANYRGFMILGVTSGTGRWSGTTGRATFLPGIGLPLVGVSGVITLD